MTVGELVSRFMEGASDDPRMGPSHIALFIAILLAFERQGGRNPVSVHSRELKRTAKFSAAGTYSKCMRDLQAGGHIRYIPGYDPGLGSLVYLVEQKNEGYGGEVAGGNGRPRDIGVVKTANGR